MDIIGLKSLLRWLRYESGFSEAPPAIAHARVKTSYASTVFSGQPAEWVRYLDLRHAERYDSPIYIDVHLSDRALAFAAASDVSRELAAHLSQAFDELQQTLRGKPAFVGKAFERAIFGNPSNRTGPVTLRVSSLLPCEASREVSLERAPDSSAVTIVLRGGMVATVLSNLRQAGRNQHPQEHLGLCWPLVRRLFSQLSFPNQPRDRFTEKIEQTVSGSLIALHVLYEGKRKLRLVPNRVGTRYEQYVSRRDHIPRAELHDRHPYFRLMNELHFMFHENSFATHRAFARVLAREYLDGRYLRLSLAGVMPEIDAIMRPMPYLWVKHKISTPYPRIGRYGILDEEDLNAWKKVEGPFREMGFTLIRQLGIGQFGRVYEACNRFNPHIPRHVALKIDRIVRGKKKEAIQSAEATMKIGEDLATAPHVIRVFDAGKLKGKRYTYHVLQLVDGDTLDNLVGISGTEHSSMLRPRTGKRSEREVQQEYLKTIKKSTREAWRRQRMTRPFVDPLNLSQTLDLMTSVLLWLEEVHKLDYAVNDLKNGNLMISRQGQLKGIDLDAYSPLTDPADRAADFFFLAISLLLLLLNLQKPREQPLADCTGMLQSRDSLHCGLEAAWPFEDVARLSHDRVRTSDTIELFVDLIERSRNHAYAHDPGLFAQDIDRLISLKRNIFATEIVLD